MSDSVLSPNMSLPVPVVGESAGPQYATDIDACLSIIDSHSHTSGSGVPITPDAININTDLPFVNHRATSLKSLTFQSQSVPLPASSPDTQAVYVSGVDLYYNDGDGNQVRITQSGGIAGTPGSISGLVSPASATYVSADSTFVWQSDANTPANMDFASAILRNLVANSKGLTLSPPNSMAADYSLVLPALPVANSFMQLDTAGNMSASIPLSKGITASNIADLTITAGQIANATITAAKLAADVITTLNPPGSIIMYGGTSAPTGYLMCDGTSYLRATYPDLYTAIGNAFGTADGTHFNVPDMRGRFPRGTDGAANRDPDHASRTAMNTGGNTGNNVGSVQSDAFASHTHAEKASNAGGLDTGIATSSVNNASLTTTTIPTAATGGNETRPINAYVNFIIKT